jgi:hypothetical protein
MSVRWKNALPASSAPEIAFSLIETMVSEEGMSTENLRKNIFKLL